MASGCNGRVRWWPGDVCAPILRASTPSPLVRVWGGGGAGVGMRGSRPKLTTFFFFSPETRFLLPSRSTVAAGICWWGRTIGPFVSFGGQSGGVESLSFSLSPSPPFDCGLIPRPLISSFAGPALLFFPSTALQTPSCLFFLSSVWPVYSLAFLCPHCFVPPPPPCTTVALRWPVHAGRLHARLYNDADVGSAC